MNSLEQYISEKLHLNSGNKKNLVIADDSVEMFLDNLENNEIRKHVIDLFDACFDYITHHKDTKDKVCYIVKNDIDIGAGTRQYMWAQNIYSEPLKVGDDFFDSKVVFVVTENTKIPEKYKNL